jgi:hypothetical protein
MDEDTSSSADGHLGCFCILTVVNSAAMNTRRQTSHWHMDFNSVGYTQKGISGLYDSSSFNFSVTSTLFFIVTLFF